MSDEPPVVKSPAHTNSQTHTAEPPVAHRMASDKQGRLDWLLNNKPALLGTLFFVTAALGLPFLWKSKSFSTTEKTIWSVIVSIYTIIILWIFCAIMWWSYSRVSESLS
ncbi:MAG: hypothetical protein Aurels2KO_16150 [Aureliella sp.]